MSSKSKANIKEALLTEFKIKGASFDFWTFCTYLDPEFFKARPFLKDIALAFQQIAEGKIKSLSVSLPPRAGKSYITTLYCAWLLGTNPEGSVMRNTCTATLYLKFSYDVRAVFKSDKFRRVFPEVTLSYDKANLQGWNTNKSKQVGFFGAGVGGTIIGFGANLCAITDDLYRGLEDALSDTVNDRVHQWKTATHDSRLESACPIIDIGTRWSTEDVIGRNMEAKVYDKSIVIPALDKSGRSFCENVLTTAEYKDKKKKMLNSIWLAEYMQSPIDIEGRLFNNLTQITREEYREQTKGLERLGSVGYIDVSDTGKDYTALAVAELTKDKIYILDVIFDNSNIDITGPKCRDLLNKHRANYCRVESNSMGAIFGRQLQKEVKTKILPIHNSSNKITRVIMQSAFIMDKFVFIKSESPDYNQFINNVLSFSKEGKNKHDDAPDCLAGLSMFIRSMFRAHYY